VITTGNLGRNIGPVRIFVGPPTGAATQDITLKVAMDSIVVEETGTNDEATCSFTIIDKTLLHTALRGEYKVTVTHNGTIIFRGYISRPRAHISAIYGEQAVSCRDVSSLLDRLIVKSHIVRNKLESDRARIQWLVDTIGQPLVQQGMTFWGLTQVLNPEMSPQTFPPRLTLRQGIERILAQSSDTGNYYMDFTPSLHTYDVDHMESGFVAPFRVATSLAGADFIAPEDLRVDWDTDGLVNGYYVQGKNEAGSGWYTDADLLPGPWSVNHYGVRGAYISAPDASNMWQARRVAKAALHDTANPIPRGSFSTRLGPNDARFRGGHLLLVWSAVHGLTGNSPDPGPWMGSSGGSWHQLQPLRVVSVSTRYLNGSGDRVQEVEFGGRTVHRYTASIPG